MTRTRTRNRLARVRNNNRLLLRFEKLLDREVRAALKRAGKRLRSVWHHGANEVALEQLNHLQRELRALFIMRLKTIAVTFGRAVLDDMRDMKMIDHRGRPLTLKAKYRYTRKRKVDWHKKGADEIFEEEVLKWIEENATYKSKIIADNFRDEVKDTLAQAFEEGWSEDETASALEDILGEDASLADAVRIARTEAHTAAGVGSDIAARSTELDLMKEWAATEDARTRITHSEADGQKVPMDDPFIVGGYELMFPGDPDGPPEEVINCRCVCLYDPQLEGEDLSDE